MKYDVEVDNYCGNKQAAGDRGEEGKGNVKNGRREGKHKKNPHENMKCKQKWGDWFTWRCVAE